MGNRKSRQDSIWYHWAFVYDGTTFYIYRNGELDVKFDPPAPSGNNFKDITGNGFDAVAGAGIIKRWEHNLRVDQ